MNGSIHGDVGNLSSFSSTLSLSYNKLSGPILRTLANQGPMAFVKSSGFCGFSLKNPCKNPILTPPNLSFLLQGPSSRIPTNQGATPAVRKGHKYGVIVAISLGNVVALP